MMKSIKRHIINSKLLEISDKFGVKVIIDKGEGDKFDVDFYFDGEYNNSACTAIFDSFVDVEDDSKCATFGDVVFYFECVIKYFDDEKNCEIV